MERLLSQTVWRSTLFFKWLLNYFSKDFVTIEGDPKVHWIITLERDKTFNDFSYGRRMHMHKKRPHGTHAQGQGTENEWKTDEKSGKLKST